MDTRLLGAALLKRAVAMSTPASLNQGARAARSCSLLIGMTAPRQNAATCLGRSYAPMLARRKL
eukprot:8694716-Pyramimonas_sp.AAC.1